jgi:hypothetical protein
MRRLVVALMVLTLPACDRPAQAPYPTSAAADELPAQGAFIGRVWISTTRGRPAGSMLIFLADRSLVMDSCFETYRVSRWGVAGDRIRWLEDTIPIEADVSLPGPDELRLHIVGQEQPDLYVTASIPYVCPDMPK